MNRIILKAISPMGFIYRPIIHKIVDANIKIKARRSPLRLIIGAGGTSQHEWISLEESHLNLLDQVSWERYFKADSIDTVLAEHVWEHLTVEEGRLAAENCHRYIKSGGYLRVAVPDGLHPSPEYIKKVKPGGIGPGADDHKVLYDYRTFSEIFTSAGFDVELLEWFDENGNFHRNEWDEGLGLIKRSSRNERRNKDGELNYTSVILDAMKK
jgi:predicted SAM-dependent methyltransferase